MAKSDLQWYEDTMGFNGYIYQVINLINDKRYIGKTTSTIEERWTHHLYDARSGRGFAFHDAIREVMQEHNTEDVERYFNRSILEICTSRSDLDASEQFWIAHLGTLAHGGWGYNLSGGGPGGASPNAATRRKLSAANFARPQDSPQVRANKSLGQIRRWARSGEHEAAVGRTREVNRRPEVQEARSLGQIRRWATPGVKEDLVAKIHEVNQRPEVRAKKSLARKLYWATPGVRESMVKKLRETNQLPAVKAKRSAAQKARQQRETLQRQL